ncbi:MAG TPA: carboxypeptidase regulatory-like domain-containing protein [Gemmatimonadaceae bacterium]|nr:carboxypeptidase regulatory-like domain-containing protein [Gemmatimonadaceae bacterium]
MMRFLGTLSLGAVVAASTAGVPLYAQQRTAPPTKAAALTGSAAIAGIVIDSLNGRYLSGADVIIEGAGKTVVTDSVGKFIVDSLPPGTYQVGVFHPLLDTLGISLATKPFHIGPDSSSFVVLAVPSAATIIRRACPVNAPRAQGTSAVIGHVTDPESLEPVSGADVSIAWTQIEVSKQIGIRRTPRVLRDSTDAQGAFKICGLPSSMHATLQARKAGAVTAEIPISLGEQEPELFARTLLLSRADSGAKTGNASVSGRVILEGAPSNAGSRVELVGTDVIALTNENGEFTMRNLPSGSHVLLARHLGFGAETVPVDLSSREPKKVSIKLPKFVAMMDPVLVTARRVASLDKVGFNQRKRSGFGYYMGPEQIQKLHANYLTDILRLVPSLRVSYSPNGDVVTSSRGPTSLMGGGDCVQYYVDDMPWMSATPGDINQFVNGSEVVGVEVYNGPGTPAQYSRAMQNCVTIVLWTKFKIRD